MKKVILSIIAILCLISCNDTTTPIENFKGAIVVRKRVSLNLVVTLRYKHNSIFKDTTIYVIPYDYNRVQVGDTIK